MSLSRLIIACASALALGACHQGDEALEDRIRQGERRMSAWMDSPDGVQWSAQEVDDVVSGLLRDYALYANSHHGDSTSCGMLMRRADLLQGRGTPALAVDQWIDVVEGCSGSAFAPEALFRVGFARESALVDTTGALEAYGELVRVYPESPWADQARMAARWLSFSESEFIRALEK